MVYGDLDSFHGIREDCEKTVLELRAKLHQQLTTPEVREFLVTLVLLICPSKSNYLAGFYIRIDELRSATYYVGRTDRGTIF